MTDKILSIIIPVYNKYNFTKSCLNDLAKLPSTHEIIIVDNGSSDETQKQLQHSKEIVYYRNDINYGFANACNRGYALSAASNVLFLNNDIRVKSNYDNWTNILLQYCDTHLVGPTMGQLDQDFNFVQEANKELFGNSYLSGWCIAACKKIWKQLIVDPYLGPFSEDYFCYFEDTDLNFTARKLNIPFKVIDIPVVHFGKQSSKQLNTYKLYTEARKIFIKKWKK